MDLIDRDLAVSTPVRGLALAVVCVGAGGALAVGLNAVGPILALAVIGAVAAWWLTTNPSLAVAALLVATVLLEDDPNGAAGWTAAFYERLPVFRYLSRDGRPPFDFVRLSWHDLLTLVAVAAVARQLIRRRQAPRLLGALTLPLVWLALTVLAGALTGQGGRAETGDLLASAIGVGYLVVIPFAVATVLDTPRGPRRFVEIAAVLAALKAVQGLVAWGLGLGRTLGSTTLTFYAPAPNWLLLMFVLAVLAALLGRTTLPRWTLWVAPAVLAALVLSYRRSFWIALALGIVVVFVVEGMRRPGRVAVAVLAIAAAGFATLAFAGNTDAQAVLVERGQLLSPSAIRARSEDRYRLDEQRNIWDEIKQDPLFGIGLGAPWAAGHPLSLEFPGGRQYSHVAVTWYWLRLGVLGAVGYVWLLATATHMGMQIRQDAAQEVVIRLAGLAVMTGLIGLAVVELTGTFTGVSPRFTVLLGAVLAWLAAARGVGTPTSEDAPAQSLAR